MTHRSVRHGAGRRLATLTAVVTISALAASCGGNSPSSSNTTAAPTTAAPDDTVAGVSDTAGGLLVHVEEYILGHSNGSNQWILLSCSTLEDLLNGIPWDRVPEQLGVGEAKRRNRL